MNFFKEDSMIVKQHLLLIDEGLIDVEDIPPLYNLKEVVVSAIHKRDSLVDETNTDYVEGGD